MAKRNLPKAPSGSAAGSAMALASARISPNRLWLGIFGLWGVLLTGFTWSFTGSPGFLQHYRVSSLYDQKQGDLAAIESEVEALNTESDRLERSVVAQEKEVRRTLGYAGPDEMIFDFTPTPFSYQKSDAVLSAQAQANAARMGRAKL